MLQTKLPPRCDRQLAARYALPPGGEPDAVARATETSAVAGLLLLTGVATVGVGAYMLYVAHAVATAERRVIVPLPTGEPDILFTPSPVAPTPTPLTPYTPTPSICAATTFAAALTPLPTIEPIPQTDAPTRNCHAPSRHPAAPPPAPATLAPLPPTLPPLHATAAHPRYACSPPPPRCRRHTRLHLRHRRRPHTHPFRYQPRIPPRRRRRKRPRQARRALRMSSLYRSPRRQAWRLRRPVTAVPTPIIIVLTTISVPPARTVIPGSVLPASLTPSGRPPTSTSPTFGHADDAHAGGVCRADTQRCQWLRNPCSLHAHTHTNARADTETHCCGGATPADVTGTEHDRRAAGRPRRGDK